MQEVVTAISTVGFPIVMCILIFYYMEKEDRFKSFYHTINRQNRRR